MILYQSDNFQWDLTAYGVSLNEENDIFTDSINKNYSLPFTIKANADLLIKLGLPTLENITSIDFKEKGRLVLPHKHYEATLFLGEIFEDNIECQINFGDAELAVYSTKLKDLPWPTQLAGNLADFAADKITQAWPATAYNFPMVYAPEIASDSNYDLFEGFVNNYADGAFLENEIDTSGEENVYINRNVLAPFPYVLEILKFGFKTAGKSVVGEVFQHPDLKRLLYMPQNYLERLDGSQYLKFSFSTRTNVMPDADGNLYNIYTREFVPEASGTYDLKFNINLDPVLASLFNLSIFRKNALSNELTLVQNWLSRNNRVQLDETVTIEVTPADEMDPIVVELTLKHTDRNIADFNTFEISFSDGQLNIFPTFFTLSDFVPDMTFGEFVNLLKNWWNIEVVPGEKTVAINFLQTSIFTRAVRDHSHLETSKTKRQRNTNRFYKLLYANTEKIFYNKDGQIFSDLDADVSDEITIEMKVQPAVVESNKYVVTAVMPEESSDLDFCLYDGLQAGKPTCPISIATKLSLQNVFKNWWENWLNFRVNSYSFKDSFECSPFEIINIEELSKKYNELHIIKKINRKIKSEKIMQVDVESETF